MHYPTNTQAIPYVVFRLPRGERTYDIYSRLLNDQLFSDRPPTRDSAKLVVHSFAQAGPRQGYFSLH